MELLKGYDKNKISFHLESIKEIFTESIIIWELMSTCYYFVADIKTRAETLALQGSIETVFSQGSKKNTSNVLYNNWYDN